MLKVAYMVAQGAQIAVKYKGSSELKRFCLTARTASSQQYLPEDLHHCFLTLSDPLGKQLWPFDRDEVQSRFGS